MANSCLANRDVSKEEKEAIEKIRETTPCVHGLNEGILLRWLRANSGHFENTCAALEKHVTFRKAWELDGLWSEWKYPEILEKHCGFGYTGVDKEGAPVLMAFFGNMDVEGMMKSIQSQDYVKYSIRPVEEGLRRCEKLAKEVHTQAIDKNGKPFEQMTVIWNLENMSSSHYSYKPFTNSYLTLVSIFQDNYPLAIKKMIVIKAPAITQYAYKLLTPFLAEQTQQTIEITGDDWLEAVYQYVDPEEWPAYFGGKKLNPDGTSGVPPDFRLGLGPVPESYFLTDGGSQMKEDCETITIYAGDKHVVEVETKKPCVRLSWQYKTAAEDIGFGIYFDKDCSDAEISEMKPIYPYIRLECSMVPVSGSILCETPGRYVIEFDNYYSWFSAKELTYSIDVQEL